MAAVEQVKGALWRDFAGRRCDWSRDLVLYVERTRSGRTLAELGKLSGMSVHAFSKAVQRMSARLQEDKKLGRTLRKALRALQVEG